MTLETFFKKFELFADAPDAVARMRQVILSSAVKGELVTQDPKDESATQLLKEIEKKRSELVLEKKAKLELKPHRSAKSDPPPWNPPGWEWRRFNDVIWCFRGHNPPKSEFISEPREGYLRFVQITDFKTDSRAVYVRESPKNKLVFKGEIIMAAYRHIGKLSRSMEGAFNVALCKVMEIPPMSRDFVELLIGTDLVKGELLAASGRAHIPSMHSAHLLSLWVPIPPLAEQKRIVAKVDELMALCDRLEAQQQERNTLHADLARASLARFAEAPTPANLNLLFHKSYTIPPADLRKSILTLAVQGKLVPQDPNDEPAKQNLSLIKAAKDQLQKSGAIAKEKKIAPLDSETLPFDLPESWCWEKLATVTELITKGSSPKWQGVAYVSENEGVLFITSENVGNYNLRKLDQLKYVENKFNEIEPRSILKHGDILMNLVGASIGRTAIYNLRECANINQAVALIRLVRETDGVCPRFLLHYFNSPSAIDYMLSSRVTSAQPNISLTNARDFAIPLPPLAEQSRIVAKVDQLMALVDQLETQLTTSRATAKNLLEALVAELTTQ